MTTKSRLISARLLLPYTILEASAMSIFAIVYTIAAHIYYCKLWFAPEKRTTKKYLRWAEKMTPEGGLATMQAIEKIALQSNANVFWLSGTLLGLERLGRPLDHDHDLDLGIMVDDKNFKTFTSNLRSSNIVVAYRTQQLGFKVLIQNPDLDVTKDGILRAVANIKTDPLEDTLPIKVDIFYHFDYRGGVMHASQNSIWWNSKFEVKNKKYGKNSFRVPADAHLHLTENYGDYITEVKEFENSIDCPNTMNIYSWASLVYLLRRKTLMIKLGKPTSINRLNTRIVQSILKGLSPHSH